MSETANLGSARNISTLCSGNEPQAELHYLFLFCSFLDAREHAADADKHGSLQPLALACGSRRIGREPLIAGERDTAVGEPGATQLQVSQSLLRVKRQTVCKPGSVPPRVRGGDGHSSGTFVAERLARPTRAAARQARPAAPARSRRRRLPLLLGLAPGGVCPAAAVAGGAVRSYRTISPLPPMPSHEHPEGRPMDDGLGGVFLWHFPWGRPRRALPGTVPPWSPDFPPSRRPEADRRAAIRPSGMGRYGMRRPPPQTARRIAAPPDPRAAATGKLPHSRAYRWLDPPNSPGGPLC